MKDAYTEVLFDAVKETSVKSGYDLPEPIEAYVVMLLTSYVEKPDFLPEEGFGPTLFRIKHFSQAKDLADTCLFVAGVFPLWATAKVLVVDTIKTLAPHHMKWLQSHSILSCLVLLLNTLFF